MYEKKLWSVNYCFCVVNTKTDEKSNPLSTGIQAPADISFQIAKDELSTEIR